MSNVPMLLPCGQVITVAVLQVKERKYCANHKVSLQVIKIVIKVKQLCRVSSAFKWNEAGIL